MHLVMCLKVAFEYKGNFMHILIVLTQKVSCTTETYETVMGLIENGIEVSVILSKNVENYNDWIRLKDKITNIYWIDTHTSKKDLLLKTIIFFRKKKSILNKINELVSAGKIADSSRILFVNDGSKDRTLSILKKILKML